MPKQSIIKPESSTVELNDALTTEQAFAIEQKIKHLAVQSMQKIYEMGEALITFKEGLGYKALGYNTFDEWVSQPDIAIGRTSAFCYMRLRRILPKLTHLPPEVRCGVYYKKMLVILPKLEQTDDPNEISEIMHTALTNSVSNLKALSHDGPPEMYGSAVMGVESDKLTLNEPKVNYDASQENLADSFGGKKVKFKIVVMEMDEEK